jgi:hypothetical protein
LGEDITPQEDESEEEAVNRVFDTYAQNINMTADELSNAFNNYANQAYKAPA